MRALIIALLLAGSATAQEPNAAINVQVFRPSPHDHDMFTVMGSHLPEHLHYTASTVLHYGHNPLVFVDRTTLAGERHAVVRDQLTLDVMASLSLWGWVDLGVALPVFLFNDGDPTGFASPTQSVSGSQIGDLRVSPKVRLLKRDVDDGGEERPGFGLALDLRVSLPTGAADAFVSDGLSFAPALIADYRSTRVHIALNVGARLREAQTYKFLTVGHELTARLGLGVDLLPNRLSLIGEVYGASSEFTLNTTYAEGILGARYQTAMGLAVTAGGGAGFIQGYGSTEVRLFAGLTWSPPAPQPPEPELFLPAPIQPVQKPQPRPAPKPIAKPVAPPTPPPARVAIVQNKIVIADKIYFIPRSARMAEGGMELLIAVAALLNDNPHVTRVRIEGHTDQAGFLRLSKRRAVAVKTILVSLGVAETRLFAVGRGAAKRIVRGTSARAREANRRVEFHIVETP